MILWNAMRMLKNTRHNVVVADAKSSINDDEEREDKRRKRLEGRKGNA